MCPSTYDKTRSVSTHRVVDSLKTFGPSLRVARNTDQFTGSAAPNNTIATAPGITLAIRSKKTWGITLNVSIVLFPIRGLTGRRVSRGPQGHRFHPLVRPPQAVATSVAHPPTRSHDRLRSGERSNLPPSSVGSSGWLGSLIANIYTK